MALRRDDALDVGLGSASPDWSPIDYVPPQGTARRVVLLGESTARGWPFEAALSPTAVLQRHLDEVGDYQCVDLAKVGANGEDLISAARCLPTLDPAVIVSFAGNNWMLSPPAGPDGAIDADPALAGHLADALRTGGYAGMRSAFIQAALQDAREYLDLLVLAQKATGASVVIAIPEYDLQGFAPPTDIETPVLAEASMQGWHELRRAAERALDEDRAGDVAALAGRMIDLDQGCSPVPGWLAGRAAMRLQDGPAARRALEQSRDAVVGLLVRSTPRVTVEVQDLLRSAADDHGFTCVDMRLVLADPDLPDLPDPACFLDFCHLTDVGIERATAALAGAVLGDGVQPTPGSGLPMEVQAFGHARGAAQLALQGQPAYVVREHLHAALRADPGIGGLLDDVRDLLAAPQPAWTHPAFARLAARPTFARFLPVLVGSSAEWPDLWLLRSSLEDVCGRGRTSGSPLLELDLLALAAPEGHLQANWAPARAHLASCCTVTTLPFEPAAPADLDVVVYLEVEYRTPHAAAGGSVGVCVDGAAVIELPVSRPWARHRMLLPVRRWSSGVHVLGFRWPVSQPDHGAAIEADASALDRRQFPTVFPVYGELYAARLTTVPAGGTEAQSADGADGCPGADTPPSTTVRA